jgi:ABC-type transporter Mla MlaB component
VADIIVENKGSAVVLRASGELVIDQAARLASGLVEALGDSGNIGIDLSSVTKIDVACLQLLCAAHKSSVRQKKVLRFDGICPDTVTHVAKDAGFGRVCGLRADDACLWGEAEPNA